MYLINYTKILRNVIMKKVILGLAIGSAVGYLVRKMQEEGKFDCIRDRADNFVSKSKRDLKNVADITKNEAGYLKERLENVIIKGK